MRGEDVDAELEQLRARGLYRETRLIENMQASRVIVDGREVIVVCSNDYLGLASHPSVRAAAAQAAEQWGAGVGASRLVAAIRPFMGSSSANWPISRATRRASCSARGISLTRA